MNHNFRQIKSWQLARECNVLIYKITSTFPKEEKIGLSSQLRRASISVSSNIAEGSGYESNAQFIRLLNIALGSICEVESQLILAADLNYINIDQLSEMEMKLAEQKRIIIGLINKLRKG